MEANLTQAEHTPAIDGGNRLRSGVALAFALTLLAFWPTLVSFHPIWTSYMYSHGYIIGGLTLWLIWRHRREFARFGAGWPLALLPMVALSLLWLVATILKVGVVQQGLLVILLVCWGIAVFGLGSAVVVLPIAATFMLAIPFWEILIPPLQALTIVVNEALLWVIRIPADVQGDIITIEAGSFQVAQSCAGLIYLLVAMVIGVLYAHLFVRGRRTGLLILALAAGISLISNWIRVLGLIVIGHVTEMQSSLMTSHHTYGWIIFTIALLPFFVLARRIEIWDTRRDRVPAASEGRQEVVASRSVATSSAKRAGEFSQIAAEGPAASAATETVVDVSATGEPSEPIHDAPPAESAWAQSSLWTAPTRILPRAAVTSALALIGPFIFFGYGALPNAERSPYLVTTLAGSGGWQLSPAGQSERPFEWQPRFEGSSATQVSHLSAGEVDVFVDHILYRDQVQGRELIQSANRIAPRPDILQERVNGPVDGRSQYVREAIVRTDQGPVLVWYWYRVAGVDTTSPTVAKLLELVAFVKRYDEAELVALSTPCGETSCEGAFTAMVSLFRQEAPDPS